MSEPAGYGRTQMLAEVSYSLAQRALTELKLLQWAFSELPGAKDLDLHELQARALADWHNRTPTGDATEMADDIAAAADRMRGKP